MFLEGGQHELYVFLVSEVYLFGPAVISNRRGVPAFDA